MRRPASIFIYTSAAILLMTATASFAAATERPTIPILDDITLRASCTHILREARERFAEIEKVSLEKVMPENILHAWDYNMILLENVLGPISILNNVHPDQKVRDAADICVLEATTFNTDLFQNEKLYARVRAVKATNATEAQLRKDLLEAFEDTGVSLSLAKRERVKAIVQRIQELSQDFERNIRDNKTTIQFTPDETRGLPKYWLDRVRKDEKGNVVVGFDSPDFTPFMMSSENAAARERYYIAYMNRGTPKNLELLDEVIRLRKEMASLYDLPSYAHLIVRRRMAENPAKVNSFLADVKKAVTAAEKKELEELAALQAELAGNPRDRVRVKRSDVSYLSEKLREKRYQIDQEELRKYFPTKETVDWILSVSSKLYGIRFEKATVPLWHPDLVYYDVIDTADGSFIGGIYLDLYPREGKYKHAAAWGVRGVSKRSNRTPISVLVTNFDRKGLTHEELETLFHEFGHVLHGVLSRTEFNSHAGTAVQRDFVEAPSQMFEEWARRYESLKTIRETCSTCPVVNPSLVERLDSARRFGRGIRYARQHLYAAFDMALAGEKTKPSIDVWKLMEADSPLGHVKGTSFPGTFGHLTGGYAAGYYGYMWSEVLALDMLSAFGDNLMNAKVGRRFRETILERGGEEPAQKLVELFLGRASNSEAFFKEIVGKR